MDSLLLLVLTAHKLRNMLIKLKPHSTVNETFYFIKCIQFGVVRETCLLWRYLKRVSFK